MIAPIVRTVACRVPAARAVVIGSRAVRRDLARTLSPSAADAATAWPTQTAAFSSETDMSYFERKAQKKQQRTLEYQARVERAKKRLTRRANSPKNVKKNEFLAFWNKRKAFQEKVNRVAKREGYDWKIDVCVILERIPAIIPDPEDWEVEFNDLQVYLSQFGKQYPPELFGRVDVDEPVDHSKMHTLEDLMDALPKGFTPAPRITEADKSGDIRTHNRRLHTYLYLATKDKPDSLWGFPTSPLLPDESFYEASQRIMKDTLGSSVDIYYPANAPLGVDMTLFPEEERKDGFYGKKTFFMKVQYDEGTVDGDAMPQNDFAWLDRDEMVTRVLNEQDEHMSKFFRYLL